MHDDDHFFTVRIIKIFAELTGAKWPITQSALRLERSIRVFGVLPLLSLLVVVPSWTYTLLQLASSIPTLQTSVDQVDTMFLSIKPFVMLMPWYFNILSWFSLVTGAVSAFMIFTFDLMPRERWLRPAVTGSAIVLTIASIPFLLVAVEVSMVFAVLYCIRVAWVAVRAGYRGERTIESGSPGDDISRYFERGSDDPRRS